MDARALKEVFKGGLFAEEPLWRHTSMGVGGPAEILAVPRDVEDIAALLAFARREGTPVHVIGRGSNLIASDRGVRALVVKIAGTLRDHRLERNVIRAGGGVALPALAHLAAEHGLSGLEFAAGIPGAIGGAVVLNAGVRDEEMGRVIREVRILRSGGAEETLGRDRLRFAYRETTFGEAPAIVLGATLELGEGDPARIREAMERLLAHRRRTQPLALPNSGSIFRNPPGDFAARLIEEAGAKGWREEGAEISTLHANFIVNTGGATAAGVLSLMKRAWRAVRDGRGIELVPEVHFLGFDAEEELMPAGRRVANFNAP